MEAMKSRALDMLVTEQFASALYYATRLYVWQTRKGSEIPYVSHVFTVSKWSNLVYGQKSSDDLVSLLILFSVNELHSLNDFRQESQADFLDTLESDMRAALRSTSLEMLEPEPLARRMHFGRG